MAGPPSTSRSSAISPAPSRGNNSNGVNTQTRVFDTQAGRILCIADVRGRLSSLNDLAKEVNAQAIIHTGDFGFFETTSLDRISDRTLRHLVLYSPLISGEQRNSFLAPDNATSLRQSIQAAPTPLLSEFSQLLAGQIKLNVPVYTVWGACEDVNVLEKFRTGDYEVENLHILDEATTRCLDLGGIKLRLLGLGGAIVPHKMFDNGEGQATIAGGQGTMWATALQIGQLVDTAQRVYDQSETRLLVTHASPGREGILAQLALVVQADLTISAGLHFRYATSYNEFSVQGDIEGLRRKLLHGKESFDRVWDSVKTQVEAVLDDEQRLLLDKVLQVVERLPPPPAGVGNAATAEDPAWKNCWNWNLCDAAYGNLVLDIKEGRVSAELKSQGFNYAYRRNATPTARDHVQTPGSVTSTLPNAQTPAAPPSRLPMSPAPGTPKVANASNTAGSSPVPPHKEQEKEHVSGTASPRVNGAPAAGTESPAASPAPEKNPKKKNGKKEKEKDKSKDKGGGKETADKVPASPTSPKVAAKIPPPPSAPSPSPSALGETKPAGQETEQALSPTNLGNESSTGVRTPTSRRPPRHPWTLYVNRLPIPVTEDELREYFGDAKAGITSIKIPLDPRTRQQKSIAFVEFGDEEAMNSGLEKHGTTIKDQNPRVSVAEDRGDPHDRPSYRGGRGGRGGFNRFGVHAAAAAAAGPGGSKFGRQKEGSFHSNGDRDSGNGGGKSDGAKKAEQA
ncbi:hypothetical protein BOTBODRAFT_32931 [Botryobasidium botryosum FD-172 SS1]|uniref:RRM domain-containing protein n=1 Tax=Botryobasidium botryosum (strain FD-172 SS1) TaxID=930990 RepID=A0A067MEE2_BOTB1|nr:hypothetical protein BOTBODRAFT_32931 [Botryobasidium botryosum FD-172 SS1]